MADSDSTKEEEDSGSKCRGKIYSMKLVTKKDDIDHQLSETSQTTMPTQVITIDDDHSDVDEVQSSLTEEGDERTETSQHLFIRENGNKTIFQGSKNKGFDTKYGDGTEKTKISFTQYRDHSNNNKKDASQKCDTQTNTKKQSFTEYRDRSEKTRISFTQYRDRNSQKEATNPHSCVKKQGFPEYRDTDSNKVKQSGHIYLAEAQERREKMDNDNYSDRGDMLSNVTNSNGEETRILEKCNVGEQHGLHDSKSKTNTDNLHDLLQRKEMFDMELQKIQSTLRGIKLDTLPDGGQRILERVKEAKECVSNVNQQLDQYSVKGASSNRIDSRDPTSTSSNKKLQLPGTKVVTESHWNKASTSSQPQYHEGSQPDEKQEYKAAGVRSKISPAKTYGEWKQQQLKQGNLAAISQHKEQIVSTTFQNGTTVIVQQPLASHVNGSVQKHPPGNKMQNPIVKRPPGGPIQHQSSNKLTPIIVQDFNKQVVSTSSQGSIGNFQPQAKQKIIHSYFTPASQVASGSAQPMAQVGIPQTQGHLTQQLSTQFTVPQFLHLPQHLQELFAAHPQAMTLYGGRMTAQRLRQVGSITTEAIDKLHKQLESCPPSDTELADPAGVKVTLMPHQRHALAWLVWREQQHPPGGILADDMGLGKTLTTLSHILRQKQACESVPCEQAWLNREKEVEKLDRAVKKSKATLIIAPASLIHQWAKEIERRCSRGALKFILYHGPKRETSIQRVIDNDIVLTTYSIVGKEVGVNKSMSAEDPVTDEKDDEQAEDGSEAAALSQAKHEKQLPLLLRIGWERIVLDEGHCIKNHKSVTAMSVCRLRAAYRIVLTGTPIQNNLLDMYSLLRFLRFSPFDEYKVWKQHIDSGGDTKRLNTIVKALLLRRTKKETNKEGRPIVDLPKRTCGTIEVNLSEEERKIYDKLFRKTQSTVREYVNRHQQKDMLQTMDMSKEDALLNGGGQSVGGAYNNASSRAPAMEPTRKTGSELLVSLLRLRQCCSHLSLMKMHLESESMETDGIELSLEEQMKGLILEGDKATIKTDGETSVSAAASLYDKSTVSSKLKSVLEKVKALSGDKSVIVSQWTQMLEVVGHHLVKVGINYSLIQGNIPPHKRMDIVDDFNTNPKGARVMLVSLRAGGVGLNLIGGNHLFLLDNHWNPALEEQACDRIYRMGQKKDVFIYRFLCKDTIEEKIVALQDKKLSLAKNVLSGSGVKSQKLSLDDLRMLFRV